MKRVLIIDDKKNLPVKGDVMIARTYDMGIVALGIPCRSGIKRWDVLYLDHDLGDARRRERTGYDVLCWLRDYVPWFLWPKKIELVTMNPVGKDRMKAVLGDMEKCGWKNGA